MKSEKYIKEYGYQFYRTLLNSIPFSSFPAHMTDDRTERLVEKMSERLWTLAVLD